MGDSTRHGAHGIIDQKERERLILEHMPQVRLIARRIQERLPKNINLEDLVSTGVIGLISAIDRFDPRHNVKLKTYAEYKIRGAILDSLRVLDWAPRQKRRKTKQIETAIVATEQQLQRVASEDEIARQLGIPLEEYHEWLVETRGLNVSSLEYAGNEQGRDLLQFLPDAEEHLPSKLMERSELERLVAQNIEQIPELERTILSLYYHQELTLREIAPMMKLHESRISQLKSRAIMRLRARLAEQWPVSRGVLPA
jgi:RNA polymerase sigma factor for flagellar operon FliA